MPVRLRKVERIGRGVDDAVAAGVDANRAANVEVSRRVHVEAHLAVVGVDEHVVGPALDLHMAIGFQFGGRFVVHGLVGGQNVIAVAHHNPARAGPHVAQQRLRAGGQVDRNARLRCGLRPGDGHQFLAGIVGEPVRKLCRRRVGTGIGNGCCRRRLPAEMCGTKSQRQRQQRDRHSVARMHPRTKAQHNKSGLSMMGRASGAVGAISQRKVRCRD